MGNCPRHRDPGQTWPARLRWYRAKRDTPTIARERLAGESNARDTIMNRAISCVSMPPLTAILLIGASFSAPASAAEELCIYFIHPNLHSFPTRRTPDLRVYLSRVP